MAASSSCAPTTWMGKTYAGVGAVANSLPKIAYPTLVGASAAKKAVFYNALDNLPLSGVTSAPTVDVVTGLEAVGASGLATPLFSHNRIFLDVDQMNISDNWAGEVLTHEIGHNIRLGLLSASSSGLFVVFNTATTTVGFLDPHDVERRTISRALFIKFTYLLDF